MALMLVGGKAGGDIIIVSIHPKYKHNNQLIEQILCKVG
jgi:hypothetical protein